MKKIEIKQAKEKLREFNAHRQYASGTVNPFIEEQNTYRKKYSIHLLDILKVK